jgi:hypothetical protein
MNMIPRARLLHSKIWLSDQFLELTTSERLLYIGLITYGDDVGRLRGDGRFLKHAFFPYDKEIDAKTVEKMVDHISSVGLIEVYNAGKMALIHHPKWHVYQKLRADRMKESEYPAPTSDNCLTNDRQASAQGKESQDKEMQDSVGKESARKEEVQKEKGSPRELMLKGLKAQRKTLRVPASSNQPFAHIDFSDTVLGLPTNDQPNTGHFPTSPLDNLNPND